MGVKYTNNAKTTISSGINNSVTTIPVASSSGFPSLSGSDYFYATLDDATNLEVVKVTAVSGTNWTVVRAQDDTTARAWSSGDDIELRLNAALLTDVVNDAMSDAFTRQAFTGDGSTTAFTLSKAPATENDLIVFIEGVFQTQSAYSVSGTTLTFSAAPANSREIIVYNITAAVNGDSLSQNNFTGDGSDTTFTLGTDPLHENNTMVFLDGVYQHKSTYSVSGTTLTFSTAPASGVAIECITHTQTEVNTPASNSVVTASIVDDNVTQAKIADDAVGADQLAASAVVTASIVDDNVTQAKIADDAVGADQLASSAVVTASIVDDAVTTAKIADDQVTLAKMAGLARGKIIYGDSSGNPAALTVGSAGTVLTSDGTDISWAEEVATNYLPLAGGTMTGNIIMGDDTSIGIADDAERIEFDGAGDISLLGANVGIGTASPSALLHINSTSDVSNRLAIFESDINNTNEYSTISVGHNQLSANFGLMLTTSDTAYIGVGSSGNAFDPTTLAGLYVNANGNVGIGTASPLMKAHIKGATGDVPSNDSNAPANGILFLDSGGGYGMSLGTDDSNTGSAWIQSQNTSTSSTEYDLLLNPNGGNVGIGTTNASYELHVEDDASETTIAVRSNVGGSGSAVGGRLRLQLGAQNNSGSGQADTQSGDTLGQILFEGQGTDYSYQGGSIATIVTTGDGDDTRSNQATAMTFGTLAVGSVSYAERMRIDSSGRIGINRTPAIANAKLEVGGADNVPLINVEASGVTGGMGVGATGLQFFHGTTSRMKVNSSGHVIAPDLNTTGSTSNRYPLYWVHTGTAGSLEPYTGSVRAMKTDIADMGSVNWIYSLTPRSFKFRDYTTDSEGNRTYLETTNDLPNTEYGLIAEEVDSVSGSDYILDKDSDDNVKGVLYHNLVPILLKSIQELEARIKTLEDA